MRVAVRSLFAEVKSIAAGDKDGLALLADGNVMGWGSNEFGQLGVDPLSPPEGCVFPCNELQGTFSAPVDIKGLSEVVAVAAGTGTLDGDEGHNLALLNNGTVMALGDNGSARTARRREHGNWGTTRR